MLSSDCQSPILDSALFLLSSSNFSFSVILASLFNASADMLELAADACAMAYDKN